MAKYVIKSKTLSSLNEALKKIMLTEYNAVTTPPEMDQEGNFTSNIETSKEPKTSAGVEVEKQNSELSKEELISKAIEKIKDSIDVASDLEDIIQSIIGKDNVCNKWKVNDDHNDVYLQSKDAHIFQQNDNILLSHNGKIELFKTVPELHEWLKKNNWPLPPAIEIHESKEILTETSISTICNAWNALVDYANGEIEDIIQRPSKSNPGENEAFFKYKDGKLLKITEFMREELKKIKNNETSLDTFRGQQKFNNTNQLKTKPQVIQALGLEGASKEELKSNPIINWIFGGQSAKTQSEVDKGYQLGSGFDSLLNDFVKASNVNEEDKGVSFTLGTNHQATVNKSNFLPYVTNVIKSLRGAYKKYKFCDALLNFEKNGLKLNDDFRETIEGYKQQLEPYVKASESVEKTNARVSSLLESSKKYPWLNEIISKNLITEDDTIGGATASFDNAVASAGGMGNSTETSTETDTTSEDSTLGDLDLNTDAPDLTGGSSSGGANFNFDFDNDDENGGTQPENTQSYVVMDIIFPESDKKEEEEDVNNMDIIVKLKDTKTGEIIEKPLNEVDAL